MTSDNVMVTQSSPDPRYVTPDGRGKGRNTYNWDAIRALFIQGEDRGGEIVYPSIKDLSDRLGIEHGTIKNKSSTERWTAQRQAHQVEVAQERQRQRVAKLSKEAIAFDERSLDAARLGVNLVLRRLAEIAQDADVAAVRRRVTLEALARGEPIEKEDLYSGIYHKELGELASALATFQGVGMRALGTDVHRLEVSGPEGGPIQQDISVKEEMQRDDPERIAQILMTMRDIGMFPKELDDAITVDVVEDESEGMQP